MVGFVWRGGGLVCKGGDGGDLRGGGFVFAESGELVEGLAAGAFGGGEVAVEAGGFGGGVEGGSGGGGLAGGEVVGFPEVGALGFEGGDVVLEEQGEGVAGVGGGGELADDFGVIGEEGAEGGGGVVAEEEAQSAAPEVGFGGVGGEVGG